MPDEDFRHHTLKTMLLYAPTAKELCRHLSVFLDPNTPEEARAAAQDGILDMPGEARYISFILIIQILLDYIAFCRKEDYNKVNAELFNLIPIKLDTVIEVMKKMQGPSSN